MFLRFTLLDEDKDSGRKRGVLVAAHELRDSDELSVDEHRVLQEALRWFNRNLHVPPCLKLPENRRALSWFKSDAKAPLSRMWALVEIMKAHGFQVEAMNVPDAQLASIGRQAGVTDDLASCHTAKVGNYTVEGHVPAAEVKRLLKEKPAIAGLAVAGMPVGSPGMEVGRTVQPYNVLAFDKTGQLKVFASYPR